ncbi:uncharacterized protein LOC131233864 [Magnolia sinica]|uniref:uncharacterized protein LOC131233864 n=1 Tax=Magnolia sinica TaxID=86752 RepID=UPI0026583D91|nr:uncharacterized protein LOC131233864 [Magnolia sinica]
MMPCEWWAMYGVDTPALQLLAVRVLAQTVSSSPCERNWSTWSLIHTSKRNRLAYEKLQKLVYCHYNMKLRERQLRVDRDMEENQDPLDLLSIGNMAQIGDDDEDPLYEWVKSADLDDAEGGPALQVAEGAAALGIDVDQVVSEQNADTDSFDPLVRSSARSNEGEEASSRPPPHHQVVVSDDDDETQPPLNTGPGDDDDSDDDDHDDDDGDERGDGGTDTSIGGTSGGRGGSGGGYTTAQSQRSVGQFTEEQSFDHATQDMDHGSRPPSRARASEPTYMFERRSKKKAGRAAADALTRSLSSMDISSDRGSSTSVPPYAHGGYHGYGRDSSDIQSRSSIHEYRQPEDSSSSHDPLTGGYSGYPYDWQQYYQGVGVRLDLFPQYPAQEMPSMYVTQFPRLGVLVQFGEDDYQRYIREFLNWYEQRMTWEQYCQYVGQQYYSQLPRDPDNDYEPPRHSMWR